MDNAFKGGGFGALLPQGNRKIEFMAGGLRSKSPERRRRRRVDLAGKRVFFRQVSLVVVEMLVLNLEELAEQVG